MLAASADRLATEGSNPAVQVLGLAAEALFSKDFQRFLRCPCQWFLTWGPLVFAVCFWLPRTVQQGSDFLRYDQSRGFGAVLFPFCVFNFQG